jgi:hypothetical protein
MKNRDRRTWQSGAGRVVDVADHRSVQHLRSSRHWARNGDHHGSGAQQSLQARHGSNYTTIQACQRHNQFSFNAK